MAKLGFIPVIALLLLPAISSNAQMWSVGPKLGYTFGPNGGITIGAEASYFPPRSWNFIPYFIPYGVTFDINSWSGHLSIHAGIEAWYFVGIEMGPTLFLSRKDGINLGMSLIGWDGYFLYPYYEMGIQFNGELYNSVGGYLKFPVLDGHIIGPNYDWFAE